MVKTGVNTLQCYRPRPGTVKSDDKSQQCITCNCFGGLLLFQQFLTSVHPSPAGDDRVMRWCWANFLGVLLISITLGQGLTALAVGVGGGCLNFFSLVYHISPLSPYVWEAARYRLKF